MAMSAGTQRVRVLSAHAGFLLSSMASLAGIAAVFAFDLYKDDIRTNAPDTAPWDDIFVAATQNAQMPGISGYHNGANIALRHLNLYITDKTQTPAVADTDHLFALQIRKFHTHTSPPYMHFWNSLCIGMKGYACLTYTDAFAQCAYGAFFQPADLGLGNPQPVCHLHLGFAVIKAHAENFLFSG